MRSLAHPVHNGIEYLFLGANVQLVGADQFHQLTKRQLREFFALSYLRTRALRSGLEMAFVLPPESCDRCTYRQYAAALCRRVCRRTREFRGNSRRPVASLNNRSKPAGQVDSPLQLSINNTHLLHFGQLEEAGGR